MQTNPGTVERTYLRLKEMAANYEFKPDSRLNEGELAKLLQTSRTPLREALNRLVAEGFFTSRSGKGFFCRSLKPTEIMHLYEARSAIECEAARLAAQRADPAQIEAVEGFLEESKIHYVAETSPTELLRLDEEFHMRVTALAGNMEMVRMLGNMNARIHFIRLIDLRTLCEIDGSDVVTTRPHGRILDCIRRGDGEAARTEMAVHIKRRLDSVTENVRTAFAELYTH